MSDALEALIRIERPRVLVVGDLIIDHYVWGNVNRVSPEAPIQVLEVSAEEDRLGGAGNVGANLAALDARPVLLGVLGDDLSGDRYEQLCAEAGVDARILRIADRPTTRKSRFIAHSQQVLRVDREVVQPLLPEQAEELIGIAETLLDDVDILLLSDYAKGVLSEAVLQRLSQAARERGLPVVADPKAVDFSRYKGAHLITPNIREASIALRRPLADDAETVHEMMVQLIDELSLDSVVVTLGPAGIAAMEKGQQPLFISARAQAVFDVSGAGDTVLAVLGMYLASNRSLFEAVEAANAAGAVVVGKLGTASVSRDELKRALSGGDGVEGGKLIGAGELSEIISDLREVGTPRIVFTNGCFDLLHPGHVRYLAAARSEGDLLVVGMNTDRSVRELKGPTRPIQLETDRAELLCALEAVDYVVLFDEPDPHDLIKALQPDVLVKGDDWKEKGAIGSDIVEARGGKVVFVPVVTGYSSSALLARIQKGEASE